MPFYGIHSFRHFAASALISSGLDVVTVSGGVRTLQFGNDFERLCSYVPDHTGESGSGDGRSVQLSSAGYNNIKQECPLNDPNSGQVADKPYFHYKRKTRKQRICAVSKHMVCVATIK